MIAIISPAKNMRQNHRKDLEVSDPVYIEEALGLVEILKGYQPWELESLLKVNPDIAMDAYVKYAHWRKDGPGTAALLAYHGLQYRNIGVGDFTKEDFRFANGSLRILTGLYGILRPEDGIFPYRLEMQTKLYMDGKNLYQFWGNRLYKELYREGRPVVNLASKEYSKTIEKYLGPRDEFITIDFKVYRNGKYRTIATSAKMARGRMVRMMIKNRLADPEQLKSFTWDGYEYVPGMSCERNYVFVQKS